VIGHLLRGLCLNPDKTEAIIIGTTARQRSEPQVDDVTVAGVTVPVARTVSMTSGLRLTLLFFIAVHDYNYDRDSWNASEYAVPRFASEFGLQSWCSVETLATVSLPTVDWDLNSSFVSHRQHHPHGECASKLYGV